MFGKFETRDKDFKGAKPFNGDRRKNSRRRRASEGWGTSERRKRVERRLDADWRFALIRRAIRDAGTSKFHFA
ncbi:MAG: hypothetical protein VW338_08545 [Rhodospirillaceae bacterium]